MHSGTKVDKWAIIGLGYISKRHIDAISAIGDELVAIHDIDDAKRMNAPAGVPYFTDYDQFKRNIDDVNWVAVCTPNDLHMMHCRDMLGLGKNVLCEKPLVLDEFDCELLQNVANVTKTKIYTMFQLRVHPLVQEIRKLKVKHWGKIIASAKRDETYWQSWKGDPKRSGGILFNFGIHYLDLLIYLFGEYKILRHETEEKLAWGKIDFNGSVFEYFFELLETTKYQERSLTVDSEKFIFSDKENLSAEGLHTKMYQAVKMSRGVSISEAVKSIKLATLL